MSPKVRRLDLFYLALQFTVRAELLIFKQYFYVLFHILTLLCSTYGQDTVLLEKSGRETENCFLISLSFYGFCPFSPVCLYNRSLSPGRPKDSFCLLLTLNPAYPDFRRRMS